MPVFGSRSNTCLDSCVPEIRVICNAAIEFIDFAVTTGHRTDEEQHRLWCQGRTMPGRIVTRLDAGESVHNNYPSPAFDFCPWPVDWDDLVQFGFVAGVIRYCAWRRDIDLAWGGDWNTFVDYPHMQIRSSNG